MTWPPTWDKAHFKGSGSRKVRRFLKRLKSSRLEVDEKKVVRGRDKFCRFPLCGCARFKLALHVSHSQHKGMGGNPENDRSLAELMILVCIMRHKESRIAIDKGVLRWEPLKKRAGSNGPIAWLMTDTDVRHILDGVKLPRRMVRDGWVEIARERAVQQWEPFSSEQRYILERLREMVE